MLLVILAQVERTLVGLQVVVTIGKADATLVDVGDVDAGVLEIGASEKGENAIHTNQVQPG